MHLSTPRLMLREFAADDWPAVLAYQSQPLYLRYVEWTERSAPAVQSFVQNFIDQQHQTPRLKYQLAIILKATGALIGNAGLRLTAFGSHAGEIGYELAPDHWGHGYATEAARAMVDLGFRQLHVHRLSAWCVADNVASAHVLEKLGFALEGRLRDKERFKERYWDVLLYGLLNSD